MMAIGNVKARQNRLFLMCELLDHWTLRVWFSNQKAVFMNKLQNCRIKPKVFTTIYDKVGNFCGVENDDFTGDEDDDNEYDNEDDDGL